MASPETVRLSLAGAMTLGLKNGIFYRNAKLGCINLLMEYDTGCAASCAYCGQGREIPKSQECRNLIRVSWPTYSFEKVLERIKKCMKEKEHVRRICIASITHKNCPNDMKYMVRRMSDEGINEISCLLTPTLFKREDILDLKNSGADMIGIAVDAATPTLFEKLRGKGVGGPHRWNTYMKRIKESVEIMGNGRVGVHLIIGLGETEEEAAKFMWKIHEIGATTHLFSFYPEENSRMENVSQPSLGKYRRCQIARYIIDNGIATIDDFNFENGKITSFNVDAEILRDRRIYMTSGCPGCNRPYANETPLQAMNNGLRNYPFLPTDEDMKKILKQVDVE